MISFLSNLWDAEGHYTAQYFIRWLGGLGFLQLFLALHRSHERTQLGDDYQSLEP